MSQIFSQSIEIKSSATLVERCFSELDLMHQWLNPLLRCQPLEGSWSTDLNARSRFSINIPLLQPTLISTIIQREPGLILWQFEGFFQGVDRWECQPIPGGTRLINTFEFTIPNSIVAFGFNLFASHLTKKDMEAQLQRLKQLAEKLALIT